MKYSISQWIYGDEPIEKSMQRMARFGYDGIEIKGEPEEYDTKFLAKLMQSYDLEASSIVGMPYTEERDLTNPSEKVREKAVNYIERCIDFARELGAALVIVVPTHIGKTKPLTPLKKEWELAVESVRKLGTYAKDRGVLIAIEPINRYLTYLLNNASQALRFIEDVGLENVKVMLDCVHMNIEEPDPAASIRKVGRNLIHLHVAENNRKSVGRGHIDFKSIIRSLKEIGYVRYLAIETFPYARYLATESFPLGAQDRGVRRLPKEELFDLYAEECIKQIRFFERVV